MTLLLHRPVGCVPNRMTMQSLQQAFSDFTYYNEAQMRVILSLPRPMLEGMISSVHHMQYERMSYLGISVTRGVWHEAQ